MAFSRSFHFVPLMKKETKPVKSDANSKRKELRKSAQKSSEDENTKDLSKQKQGQKSFWESMRSRSG